MYLQTPQTGHQMSRQGGCGRQLECCLQFSVASWTVVVESLCHVLLLSCVPLTMFFCSRGYLPIHKFLRFFWEAVHSQRMVFLLLTFKSAHEIAKINDSQKYYV